MSESRLMPIVQTYWPVVVGGVMIAVAWGANTAQIGSIAEGNKAILVKLDKLSDQQSTFQATVAATKVRGDALDQAIVDLRDRVRTLEARR